MTGKPIDEEDQKRITLQLNKLYLQLINLYLATDRLPESQFLVEQTEARLEQALDEQFTFKLFNELANTLRKHDNLRLAI